MSYHRITANEKHRDAVMIYVYVHTGYIYLSIWWTLLSLQNLTPNLNEKKICWWGHNLQKVSDTLYHVHVTNSSPFKTAAGGNNINNMHRYQSCFLGLRRFGNISVQRLLASGTSYWDINAAVFCLFVTTCHLYCRTFCGTRYVVILFWTSCK